MGKVNSYSCCLCGKNHLEWRIYNGRYKLFENDDIHKCNKQEKARYLIKRIREYKKENSNFNERRFFIWYIQRCDQFRWEFNYGIKPIHILNKIMLKDKYFHWNEQI